MEGQDQSPRILCRAREIGRNETSQAKMEFSWGKRNLHTRRTRAPPPPPWNTGMCEHLPPSASSYASASASASSFLNAESANNFKERPTDGYGMQQRQRRRHMLLASLAFFVGSLLEVHVQVGCIFLSGGFHCGEREGRGTTCDLAFTAGGRSLTSTIYMNEEAWRHGMKRMLAPCRSHR